MINTIALPIYVINLKADIAKRQHMLALCKQNGLVCEVIDAVRGAALSPTEIEAIYDRHKSVEQIGRELTPGELGCALSHIKIYRRIVAQHQAAAIIFEDDIDLEAGFKSVIAATEHFPTDWELMLLGHYSQLATERETRASFRGRRKLVDGFEAVRLVELAYGTHAYMITFNGAKKLLEQLSMLAMPIDHYTGSDILLNMYAVTPRPVKLHAAFKGQSNIAPEIALLNPLSISVSPPGNDKILLRKLGVVWCLRPLKKLYDRIKTLRNYT